MLQQTTVTAVVPYYDRFVRRFPTLDALAAAPVEDVLAAWAGLGYYARARNLHACARAVAGRAGFRASAEALRALPGIGPYTATAIAAIAFGAPGVPVDGNVERVVARRRGDRSPAARREPLVRAAAAALGNDPAARARPADFAQALFDLGATVCTPATPACALCPWRGGLRRAPPGIAGALPRKAPKAARPARLRRAFLADRCRRPGAAAPPAGDGPAGRDGWNCPAPSGAPRRLPRPRRCAPRPPPAAWRKLGEVRHGFTHFALTLDVYAGTLAGAERRNAPVPGMWRPIGALAAEALPSVMRKCVALAGEGAG